MPRRNGSAGTIRGKYCSPLAESRKTSSGDSCYSKEQLKQIIQAYNAKNTSSNRIEVSSSATKSVLWDAIQERMVQQCEGEACWAQTLQPSDMVIDEVFRPERPVGKYQWLSTTDIHDVLKQYEALYPNFVFLGPVPMDFCSLTGNAVCNVDLRALQRNGVNKVGVVFNTDPSTEPGKHWVSMFIDLEEGQEEIGYFDSYGMAPLAPQVQHLIKKVQQQFEDIHHRPLRLNLNCDHEMCVTKVQHQRNNSECGVYSINFIVQRLTGKPWAQVVQDRQTDEQMARMRRVYFRPQGGGYHRY